MNEMDILIRAESTKEQKERLIKQLARVINEAILNEMDCLRIVHIYSDACNWKQVELFESFPRDSILSEDEEDNE